VTVSESQLHSDVYAETGAEDEEAADVTDETSGIADESADDEVDEVDDAAGEVDEDVTADEAESAEDRSELPRPPVAQSSQALHATPPIWVSIHPVG
jgi:hypothetical protein